MQDKIITLATSTCKSDFIAQIKISWKSQPDIINRYEPGSQVAIATVTGKLKGLRDSLNSDLAQI